MNEYYKYALKEADKAYKKKEVPVGAIIVKDNKIIAKAYNKRVKSKNVLGHAEVIAIKKAAKKLKDWRLNGCEMYVTLEPCEMCREIIKESRISKVYYLTERLDTKKKYDKTEFLHENCVESQKYAEKLSTFFKINCNRN